MKTKTCPNCKGEGYFRKSDTISTESSSCQRCHGLGKINVRKCRNCGSETHPAGCCAKDGN